MFLWQGEISTILDYHHPKLTVRMEALTFGNKKLICLPGKTVRIGKKKKKQSSNETVR